MKVLKVREDDLKDNVYKYSCKHCKKSFNDKDVIFELDLYDDIFKFCSNECILKWFEKDITQKVVEVYPVPDEVKLYREVRDRVNQMKANTKIVFNQHLTVEYFKIDGMSEHYIVREMYNHRIFTLRAEVTSYIFDRLIKQV